MATSRIWTNSGITCSGFTRLRYVKRKTHFISLESSKLFFLQIHPKMIYNRPPLNCQKCQYRFFTDQGLERHLLGSHGLVTSSMQEAANKGKDAGRCPVCGRVSASNYFFPSPHLVPVVSHFNIASLCKRLRNGAMSVKRGTRHTATTTFLCTYRLLRRLFFFFLLFFCTLR